MTPGSRHVLVTGASGYVGGAVARALLDAGHAVTGLVRDPIGAAPLAAAGARLHTGDMLRPDTYVPLVAGVDAVVHAAQLRAPGRLTRSRIGRMLAADGVMAAALARACLAGGKRLLYASGGWIYGDHGAHWIEESAAHRPAPLGTWHAQGVAMLRELGGQGLDFIALHAGFVYGPGGNFERAFAAPAAAGRIRYPGDGTNYWSCVHLDDLAAAHVAALERAPARAEYNVADDSPLPLAAFAAATARAFEARPAQPVPRPAAALALGLPAVRSLTTSYRLSNARARAELGWQPRYPSVVEGLPSVARALRPPALTSTHNALKGR
ncbi:NAD-dependent epimerase/dehydratase family protein [Streptomyces boninensis]|uniref:NAD-dependent epimerase/dehydratase family protein n=1 Tax=Streptomyces boninensis TaxID=2039455 RepID=UPI003B2272C4